MTAEQQLIALYRRVAKRLRIQIAADLEDERIGTAIYRQRQLAQINVVLGQLDRQARQLPAAVVAEAYDKGAGLADVAAGRLSIREAVTVRYAFNGAHERAPRVLADNIARGLAGARVEIGRRVEDVYRSTALDAIAEGIIAGDTRRETSGRLKAELLRNGVTGFVARNGARWQLDTYVEMVTRTTTREAMTAGTEERMTETGDDLVEISDHATETEICKEFEGNVYSLTGKTPGYPILGPRPPFHPRCLHYMTPAGENLDAALRALGIA